MIFKKIRKLLDVLNIHVDSTGASTLEVSMDVMISGKVRAREKYFTIKHPDPEKKDQYLAHSCVESNQHTVLYAHRITYFDQDKWTVDINSGKYIYRIQLPPYFKHLVRTNTVTAIVTPINSMPSWFYACEQNPDDIAQNIIRIESNQVNSFNVLVMGVRSDLDDFVVEFDEDSKHNVRRRVGQPEMPDNRKKDAVTKPKKERIKTIKGNTKEVVDTPVAPPPPPPKPESQHGFGMFTEKNDL